MKGHAFPVDRGLKATVSTCSRAPFSKLVSESVGSVDSPRGAVGGDTLANRRIARWACGVLEGEADRFLFAILERCIWNGVLHRIDRSQVGSGSWRRSLGPTFVAYVREFRFLPEDWVRDRLTALPE